MRNHRLCVIFNYPHGLRTAEGDSPSTEEEENTIGVSLEVPVQDIARQRQVYAFNVMLERTRWKMRSDTYVADASSDAFLL